MIYVIIVFAVIIFAAIGYGIDRKKYEQYKNEILGGEDMSNTLASDVAQVESISNAPQEDGQQAVPQINSDTTNDVQSN